MPLNLSFSACGTASIPRPNVSVSGCVKYGQPSASSANAPTEAKKAGGLTRPETSRMSLHLAGRK